MRYIPLVLLAAFWITDGLAGWRLIPAISVSELFWKLGWLGRILTLPLFIHLWFKWPFGPS